MYDDTYDFGPKADRNLRDFKANRSFTLITRMSLIGLVQRLQAQPITLLSLWKVDMRDLTFTTQDYDYPVARLSLSGEEIVFTYNGKTVGEVKIAEQTWEERDDELDATVVRITHPAPAPYLAFWSILQEEPTQKLK